MYDWTWKCVQRKVHSFALAMWATTPRPENHLKQPPNNGKKCKKEQEQEQELSGAFTCTSLMFFSIWKGYVKIKSENTVLVFIIMWLYLLLYQLTVSGVLPWSPFYPWKKKNNTNHTIINLQHILLRIPLHSSPYSHVQHMVLTEHRNLT